MKRINLIIFLLTLIIMPLQVKALSISASEKEIILEKGNNGAISLYTEVEEEITQLNFTLTFSSYDVPAYFVAAEGLTHKESGIKQQITFSEPVSGKIELGTIKVNVKKNATVPSATIDIYGVSAINSDEEIITNQGANIIVTVNVNQDNTVTTTDNKKQETNLLEKIESKIVKIDLKKDTYKYEVNIDNTIKELDLKPIAKNDKYKVEISTQKISELKDNTITITVEDGEYKEEYKITVNKMIEQDKPEEQEQEKTEIDNSKFKPTYNYKGKWIVVIIVLTVGLLIGLIFIKKSK